MEHGDDQVVSETLLVVREQNVATNGKIRFFHQLCQVFGGGSAEFNEVAAIDKALQPAAKREGTRLSVEKAPPFAGLGVVGDIQVVQQVFSCLRFDQLSVAEVKYRRAAVWILVDLVDDAVADGHMSFSKDAEIVGSVKSGVVARDGTMICHPY